MDGDIQRRKTGADAAFLGQQSTGTCVQVKEQIDQRTGKTENLSSMNCIWNKRIVAMQE